MPGSYFWHPFVRGVFWRIICRALGRMLDKSGRCHTVTRANNRCVELASTYPRVIPFSAGQWTSAHRIGTGILGLFQRKGPFPSRRKGCSLLNCNLVQGNLAHIKSPRLVLEAWAILLKLRGEVRSFGRSCVQMNGWSVQKWQSCDSLRFVRSLWVGH